MRILIPLSGQISNYNIDHPKTLSKTVYPSKTQPNDNNFKIKITFSYIFWDFLTFSIFFLFSVVAIRVFFLADDRQVVLTVGGELVA